MFTLESPHRGDSNEYTRYAIFNIKKKIILNYPKSAFIGFFAGSQQRVRNSRGNRAISVVYCILNSYAYGKIFKIGLNVNFQNTLKQVRRSLFSTHSQTHTYTDSHKHNTHTHIHTLITQQHVEISKCWDR